VPHRIQGRGRKRSGASACLLLMEQQEERRLGLSLWREQERAARLTSRGEGLVEPDDTSLGRQLASSWSKRRARCYLQLGQGSSLAWPRAAAQMPCAACRPRALGKLQLYCNACDFAEGNCKAVPRQRLGTQHLTLVIMNYTTSLPSHWCASSMSPAHPFMVSPWLSPHHQCFRNAT